MAAPDGVGEGGQGRNGAQIFSTVKILCMTVVMDTGHCARGKLTEHHSTERGPNVNDGL